MSRSVMTIVSNAVTNSIMEVLENATNFSLSAENSPFNLTQNNSQQSDHINDIASILEYVKIPYLVICVVGVIGNGLVIYGILKFKRMKSVNIYILNLAIADEICLLGLPLVY